MTLIADVDNVSAFACDGDLILASIFSNIGDFVVTGSIIDCGNLVNIHLEIGLPITIANTLPAYGSNSFFGGDVLVTNVRCGVFEFYGDCTLELTITCTGGQVTVRDNIHLIENSAWYGSHQLHNFCCHCHC